MTETTTVVVGARRTRRRRKVKTRIGSLVLGTIQSDFATVEQTHQNSLPKSAVLVTLAIVATIYENI